MRELAPRVIEKAVGNFVLTIQDVSVSFFGYGAPLVGELARVENVAVASRADIGLMKLDALITCGARKDFYDLYFIAREIPLIELFRLSAIKFPWARDFPMLVFKTMILLDNADRDLQSELIEAVEWITVKNIFVAQAKFLRRDWFGF